MDGRRNAAERQRKEEGREGEKGTQERGKGKEEIIRQKEKDRKDCGSMKDKQAKGKKNHSIGRHDEGKEQHEEEKSIRMTGDDKNEIGEKENEKHEAGNIIHHQRLATLQRDQRREMTRRSRGASRKKKRRKVKGNGINIHPATLSVPAPLLNLDLTPFHFLSSIEPEFLFVCANWSSGYGRKHDRGDDRDDEVRVERGSRGGEQAVEGSRSVA